MLKRLFVLIALVGLFAVGCDSGVNSTERAKDTPPPAVTATAEPAEASDEPTVPELNAGWTRVEPGGETVCSHGDPYAFWVRRGSVNKLLVYFQEGGGCWDAASCQAGLHDPTVSSTDDPSNRTGIFADDPENPFNEYYMVFVPYCTGDLHWGNNEAHYENADGDEVIVQHKGFVNSTSALDWIYDSFSGPENIFVTGCSAGSVGSILYTPYLIEHYPEAEINQLGDSLAFVADGPLDLDWNYRAHANFPDWIPALSELTPETFTMAKFYSAVANYYPDHTFAQFNWAHDSVQIQFYNAGGNSGDWRTALDAGLNEIQTNADNFRSFIGNGSGHCIVSQSNFTTHEVDGVRFRDWIADLAAGNDVDSVTCEECQQ